MTDIKLGRILIVDDEKELMQTLCDMLSKHGYETRGFTRAHEALEVLKREEFDLLITDLVMSEIDGIELLQKVRTVDENIKVIMITGQATIETAVESMKKGALDYITKPFKMKSLLPVISRGMEMHRLKTENIQLNESKAIYELCLAMAFTLEPGTILTKAAEAVMHHYKAQEVTVLLPTRDGRNLNVVACLGENKSYCQGMTVPIEHGDLGWVASHREPLFNRQACNDSPGTPSSSREDPVSTMTIPVIVSGRLGAIMSIVAKNHHPFTLGQIKSLSIIASFTSSALENSWLHAELREAEKKYRSIFENSSDGIFQVSPSGRFMVCNASMAGILGYDSPEELMTTVTDIAGQVFIDDGWYEKIVSYAEEQGSIDGIEGRAKRRDGVVITVNLSLHTVKGPGNEQLCYEGAMQDITARKLLEEQMIKNRELEALKKNEEGLKMLSQELARSNKELEIFAQTVSHDLRAPLRKVTTFGEKLRKYLGDSLDAQALDYLTRMENATRHMTQMITGILEFARVFTTPKKIKKVDIAKVIEDVKSDLEIRIREEGAVIEVGDMPVIEADPIEIGRLFTNLIENSLKYHKGSPRISIRSREPETGFHEITVRDNGVGFDEKHLGTLFDPFRQLSNSRTHTGMGIGLSICHKIVERYNGTITVKSPPGEGAEFIITLPSCQCFEEDVSPSSEMEKTGVE